MMRGASAYAAAAAILLVAGCAEPALWRPLLLRVGGELRVDPPSGGLEGDLYYCPFQVELDAGNMTVAVELPRSSSAPGDWSRARLVLVLEAVLDPRFGQPSCSTAAFFAELPTHWDIGVGNLSWSMSLDAEREFLQVGDLELAPGKRRSLPVNQSSGDYRIEGQLELANEGRWRVSLGRQDG